MLEPVDLEGKACPCASGWVCDEETQTCLAASAAEATGTQDSSGAASEGDSDASSEGTGFVPQARFEVLAFSADWSTPESIHWTWEVAGDESDFHAWTLWVSTDEAALASGEDVRVFDGATNPELDRFALKNTMEIDPVVGTLTRGLEPGTDYFAKLLVFDTAGGQAESPNVAVRSTTDAPTDAVVIFGDDPLTGGAYPLPVCFERTDVNPYAGTHDFALDLRCTQEDTTCEEADPTVVECWENLRLEEMNVPLIGLGGGDLSDAFLEFHLAIDAPEGTEGHGWWSMAGIRLEERGFTYAPLTFPATAEYERFQIPLSVLGVTLDDLSLPLSRFFVGSIWQNGADLRVDEVRIRW